MGAGKRAFDVAEELALEEFMRHGRAVHLDQRPFVARAGRVDDMGDELLADTRFALNEHARIGLRHGLEAREHLFQSRTLANHLAEVHRHLNFLAQVVALELELLAQLGVLLECRAELPLRLVAFGHVLARNEQSDHPAVLIEILGRRNQRFDDFSIPSHKLPRLVLERAVRDDVFKLLLRQRLSCVLA